MAKLLLIFRIILGIGFFASLICWIYLIYSYSAASPAVPDVHTGQIYAINIHGYVSYITKQQRYGIWGSFCGAVLCFLLTGIEAMSASTTAGVTQACASHHREAEYPSNRVDKITGIAACEDQYPRTRPQKQKCLAGTEQIFSIICRTLVHSLYPEKQCS